MTRNQDPTSLRSLLLPFGTVVLCVFLWPAMLTFDAGDWPSPNQFPQNSPPHNACGMVGAVCAYYLRYYLGAGAYPLLLFATVAALVRVFQGRVTHGVERAFGVALMVASTSVSAHLLWRSTSAGLPVGNGGVIGYSLGELLTGNLSGWGTGIIVASCLVIGLVFAAQDWILRLPAALRRTRQGLGSVAGVLRRFVLVRPPVDAAERGVTAEERSAILEVGPTHAARRRKRRSRAGDSAQEVLFDDELESEAEEVAHKSNAELLAEPDAEEQSQGPEKARVVELTEIVKSAKAPAGPIVNFPSPQRTALAEPYPRQIENWRLPSLSLLEQPEYGFTTQQEAVVREQARILEQTLEEFRLDARVVEIDTGPVITMFELKLGAGIKVSQIATLSNDIARALKAHAIRVVAPISGKNTVGIEVPNTQKERVRLRELMTIAGKKASGMRLPLFLGKDAGGTPLVADLTKMPHLLIAGTTGSGKSVCLNAVILSMLMTKRPDHVKMILLDPKMVEMSQFKDVPHLMCPIVTDMGQAEKILEWAVTKMEERYEILAEARVKNIAAYNRLGPDELYARLKPGDEREKARIVTRLPYVVIFIDELADLMMTSAKEVENHLSRLAQKSRAVGVHIIVATQRPEAKVVTGLIKSNLPSRICFRVASRMDSRIVLDQNGGEVLLGQGDMLFLPPGSHKLVRAQGTFLEDGEIQAVLEDLASRAQPEFHPELVQLRQAGRGGDASMRDPLFDRAVRTVIESGRGSVSLLQRRLTIGYSRASRLIEQMAEAGIVGDYKGSQAREVTITIDQWDAIQAQAEADADAGYEADADDRDAANGAAPWDDDSAEPARAHDYAR